MKLLIIFIFTILLIHCSAFLNNPFQGSLPWRKRCKINVNDRFPEKSAFFKYFDQNRLLLPNENGSVVLNEGDMIEACCPNYCVEYKCLGGIPDLRGIHLFEDQDGKKIVDIRERPECAQRHIPAVKRTNLPCLGSGTWLRSGLDSRIMYGFGKLKDRFIELYRVCFDDSRKATLLVVQGYNKSHLITRANVESPDRWFFGDFFEGIPRDLFTKTEMFLAILKQLDYDVNLAHQIMNPLSTKFYYARGHLAPKNDYSFAPEQLATFSMLNVVPQMQSINNGNWARVERELTKYINETRNSHITILTGAFGVLTVDLNKTNCGRDYPVKKSLYLYPDGNQVPIPKAVYKIIRISPQDIDIVVITVNNHFDPRYKIEDPREQYVICADTCASQNYFNCNDKNNIRRGSPEEIAYMQRGYTYTCRLGAFIAGLYTNYGIDLSEVYNTDWRREGF